MNDSEDVAARVVALLELGRTAAALSLASSELARDPSNPRMSCLVGVCHIEGGGPALALPFLRSAVVADPDDPVSLRLLSYALSRVGDDAAAMAVAIDLVRLAPLDIDARVRWAECLGASGRRDEALANAHWVVAQRPEDPEAHLLLAVILVGSGRRSRGDLAEADAAVDRAAALDPWSVRVGAVRAVVGVSRARPLAAVRAATDTVHLDPTDRMGHDVAMQVLRLLVLLPYLSLALVVLIRVYALFVALGLTLAIAIGYAVVVRRHRWAFLKDFFGANRHYAIAEAMLWGSLIWLLSSWAVGAPSWAPGAGALLAVLVGGISLLRAPDPK